MLAVLTANSSPITAALGSLIMGLGMGLMSVSSLVLIQELVDLSQRGSATVSNMFARNIGSTLGATLLGAVFNYRLSRAHGGKPVTSDQLREILDAGVDPAAVHSAMAAAFQQSLHVTFWAMLVISCTIVFIAFQVPQVEIHQAGPCPTPPRELA